MIHISIIPLCFFYVAVGCIMAGLITWEKLTFSVQSIKWRSVVFTACFWPLVMAYIFAILVRDMERERELEERELD